MTDDELRTMDEAEVTGDAAPVYAAPMMCRACWDRWHPEREPVRVRDSRTERCCLCLVETDSGIFVRVPWAWFDRDELPIFTVFAYPPQYPEGFAVMRTCTRAGDSRQATWWLAAPTLAEARALVPEGLAKFMRDPADDPAVLESWM